MNSIIPRTKTMILAQKWGKPGQKQQYQKQSWLRNNKSPIKVNSFMILPHDLTMSQLICSRNNSIQQR